MITTWTNNTTAVTTTIYYYNNNIIIIIIQLFNYIRAESPAKYLIWKATQLQGENKQIQHTNKACTKKRREHKTLQII